MPNIMIAPGKYVQGWNLVGEIGHYVKPLGQKFFCILTSGGQHRMGNLLSEGMKHFGCAFETALFQGECSKEEIARLSDCMKHSGCDAVVGIGGGKVLDTAKAVAYERKAPVVIVPTTAATDAPCSALSVIYAKDGKVDDFLFLPSNPNVVLVDTKLICEAPVRLFVSGMGDALATYFETRAAVKTHSHTCAGGTATRAAFTLAQLCYETLMEDGVKAKLAVEKHVCTKAVENIIEANTYLSGIGFESGGVAAAHAVHNALTLVPECHEMYHGEKVAFGVMVQLVLENAPQEEMEQVLCFCKQVGLPVTLDELGITQTDPAMIRMVAKRACSPTDTMKNLSGTITEEMVYDAILCADKIGKSFVHF
jgi:glycerol dehydrogenase